MPEEEAFPVPLKYIDVARSIHTDLDVLQEKKIDDYWNVDSCKPLSDSWRGFTQFNPLKEKPPKRYMWFSGKIDKRSKRLPDQIMYVQKFGRQLVKLLRIEKNRKGHKRNRSLTMLES